jgi:hypothetical protein
VLGKNPTMTQWKWLQSWGRGDVQNDCWELAQQQEVKEVRDLFDSADAGCWVAHSLKFSGCGKLAFFFVEPFPATVELFTQLRNPAR